MADTKSETELDQKTNEAKSSDSKLDPKEETEVIKLDPKKETKEMKKEEAEAASESKGESSKKSESDSTNESTDLEKKIVRQIEYYFGNANLRRDRFLQLQIREDDGWVTMETMLTFNRLSNLSTDAAAITTALGKSKSGLMEISEDKQKIRRSPENPLPEENAMHMLDLKLRTVYCKGIPLDEKIDGIQEFMDKFGETEAIYMRRDKEREFKGSVFVTFKTKADADKFMAPESLKYGDTETVRYFKSDYYKMKAEERKVMKDQSKKEKKDEKEQKDQEIIEATTEYKDFDRGLVLSFTGASDQTSREDLREVFDDYGTVSWIDFKRGDTKGTIRFEKDSLVKDIIEKVLGDHNDKLEIRGSILTMRVLEGEEEDQHWKEVFENRAKIRLIKQQGRRRNKGDRRNDRWSDRRNDRRNDRRGHDRHGGRKPQFEGKKKTFDDSDNEKESKQDTGNGNGKRPLEGTGETEAPLAKHAKTD